MLIVASMVFGLYACCTDDDWLSGAFWFLAAGALLAAVQY